MRLHVESRAQHSRHLHNQLLSSCPNLRLVPGDGEVVEVHAALLTSQSALLRTILTSQSCCCGDGVLLLPDVSSKEVDALLGLLTRGWCCNAELEMLESLYELMKLLDIQIPKGSLVTGPLEQKATGDISAFGKPSRGTRADMGPGQFTFLAAKPQLGPKEELISKISTLEGPGGEDSNSDESIDVVGLPDNCQTSVAQSANVQPVVFQTVGDKTSDSWAANVQTSTALPACNMFPMPLAADDQASVSADVSVQHKGTPLTISNHTSSVSDPSSASALADSDRFAPGLSANDHTSLLPGCDQLSFQSSGQAQVTVLATENNSIPLKDPANLSTVANKLQSHARPENDQTLMALPANDQIAVLQSAEDLSSMPYLGNDQFVMLQPANGQASMPLHANDQFPVLKPAINQSSTLVSANQPIDVLAPFIDQSTQAESFPDKKQMKSQEGGRSIGTDGKSLAAGKLQRALGQDVGAPPRDKTTIVQKTRCEPEERGDLVCPSAAPVQRSHGEVGYSVIASAPALIARAENTQDGASFLVDQGNGSEFLAADDQSASEHIGDDRQLTAAASASAWCLPSRDREAGHCADWQWPRLREPLPVRISERATPAFALGSYPYHQPSWGWGGGGAYHSLHHMATDHRHWYHGGSWPAYSMWSPTHSYAVLTEANSIRAEDSYFSSSPGSAFWPLPPASTSDTPTPDVAADQRQTTSVGDNLQMIQNREAEEGRVRERIQLIHQRGAEHSSVSNGSRLIQHSDVQDSGVLKEVEDGQASHGAAEDGARKPCLKTPNRSIQQRSGRLRDRWDCRSCAEKSATPSSVAATTVGRKRAVPSAAATTTPGGDDGDKIDRKCVKIDTVSPEKKSRFVSYRCGLCQGSYCGKTGVLRHCIFSHFRDEILDEMRANDYFTDGACTLCRRVCAGELRFIQHYGINHKGVYKYMEACGKFKSLLDLKLPI